jgi:hypothetical protein
VRVELEEADAKTRMTLTDGPYTEERPGCRRGLGGVVRQTRAAARRDAIATPDDGRPDATIN